MMKQSYVHKFARYSPASHLQSVKFCCYTGAPCIKGSYKKKSVPQLLVRRNPPEYKVSKSDLTFVNGAVLIDLHPIEVHIRIEMLYVFIQ